MDIDESDAELEDNQPWIKTNKKKWKKIGTIGKFAKRATFPAPIVTQNIIDC